jgi:hypothetical protein
VTATAVGAPARPAPFKGLVPYTEEDAAFFFGREEEIEVVIANLEARRLTLLYGESGAGKSSLLRAGVSHRLLETARRNLEEIGTPELVPVYFASWRDDPLAALVEAIAAATSTITGEAAADPPQSGRLDEAIERASGDAQADILIVLDQFEEYFLYHEVDRGERTFADGCRAPSTTPAYARALSSRFGRTRSPGSTASSGNSRASSAPTFAFVTSTGTMHGKPSSGRSRSTTGSPRPAKSTSRSNAGWWRRCSTR